MNPKLVSNINGTHKFSFDLYYLRQPDKLDGLNLLAEFLVDIDYLDLLTSLGEDLATNKLVVSSAERYNPLVPCIRVHSKIKVKWNNKWYDFVVDNIVESTDKKTVTYNCVDQFIYELSKNGYNLEFANELENSIDTALHFSA